MRSFFVIYRFIKFNNVGNSVINLLCQLIMSVISINLFLFIKVIKYINVTIACHMCSPKIFICNSLHMDLLKVIYHPLKTAVSPLVVISEQLVSCRPKIYTCKLQKSSVSA